MARHLALLELVGVALVAAWLAMPGDPGASSGPILAVLAVIGVNGLILLALRGPLPFGVFPPLVAVGAVAVGAAIHFSGEHTSPLVLFYLWIGAYAGWFFPRRWLAFEVVFVAASFGLVLEPRLDAVDSAQWLLVIGATTACGVLLRTFKRELIEGERRFLLGSERAGIGVGIADTDGRFLRVNAPLCEMLGRSREELERMSWADVTHPDDLAVSHAMAEEAAVGRGDHARFEKRYLRPDGETVWGLVTISPVRDRHRRTLHVFVQIIDITPLRRTEHELSERVEQQTVVAKLGRQALEVAPQPELVQTAVKMAARTLGVPYGAVWVSSGDDCLRLFAGTGWPEDTSRQTVPANGCQLGFTLHSGSAVRVEDFRSDSRFTPGSPLRALGIRSAVSVLIPGRGEPFGVLSVHATEPRRFTEGDASFLKSVAHVLGAAFERRYREDEIRHNAVHDPLTGLPNRTLLVDRLAQVLAHRRRTGGDAAVLALDVDKLKLINDSLGHEAGDQVLAAMAPRIAAALRPTDTVARFAGDLFVIVCGDLQDDRAAVGVAERLLEEVSRPFDLVGEEVVVRASIGIALAVAERGPEELIRDADAAMHRAKARGGNGYEVFDQRVRVRIVERVRVESELHRALDRDELRLHYQPVVALASGAVVGVEALLRWDHPQRGLVLPGEFIPVAEESGLIVPIGRFVVDASCRQIGMWQTAGRQDLSASVSANVSARELVAPDFVASLREALARTGTDPGRFSLELTETMLMDDLDSPLALMAAVKQLGIELALDDFGTGYSSLSYLQRFPLDTIKIDRTLVSKVASDAGDRAIVGAAITMARTLGRRVIAEGVETAEQAAVLKELGCEAAQGYLFARPMPPDRLAEWASGRPAAVEVPGVG